MPEPQRLPHSGVEWHPRDDTTWQNLPATVGVETAQTLLHGKRLGLSFVSDSSPMRAMRVAVATEDFPALLSAMCDVDRGKALAAMSAELAKHLGSN